ncbi:hypothetical protein GHT09_013017 [Marmota monax]|uniref:Uncharacterized protein n=1 Tax=Marmota monax TaxID=9995 RepID=A0A834QFN2_MARMO|nr:hypothetical protein GHT09_013017 [Marmota monax]
MALGTLSLSRAALTTYTLPHLQAPERGPLRLPHALGAERDGATGSLAPTRHGEAVEDAGTGGRSAEFLLSSGRGNASKARPKFGRAREGMEEAASQPGHALPSDLKVPTGERPPWVRP